jgi:pimeloyl-ACP methyl ester carboxylesterase
MPRSDRPPRPASRPAVALAAPAFIAACMFLAGCARISVPATSSPAAPLPPAAPSAAALPPAAPSPAVSRAKILPLPGEQFTVAGRPAFLIPAPPPTTATAAPAAPKPWVWYAPTLPPYPGNEERWLIERLLAAGVAIAGIDVGESYGSPAGRAQFTALHDHLVHTRGYAPKPVLLGRSRGGLQLLAWAADHPDRVAAFAGIYPVCNLLSFPGLAKAAPAYGLTSDQLAAALAAHNPVDRLAPLAAARIPLFAIHGDVDKLVPLATNSALVRDRYAALGGTMELIVPAGQGHNLWSGFFESPALLAFVLHHARPQGPRSP